MIGNAVQTPRDDGSDGGGTQLTYALLDIDRRRQAEAQSRLAQASLARIITPVDVSITPYVGPVGVTDVQDAVVAEFRIETYVLPPPAPTPPPAQVGG